MCTDYVYGIWSWYKGYDLQPMRIQYLNNIFYILIQFKFIAILAITIRISST